MARKGRIKTSIAEQTPAIRENNFEKVYLGCTLAEGQEEAIHCLQCKNVPCIAKCPMMIDIPGFILAIREGSMEQAADILSRYTSLLAVCGRVCPQEKQCEQICKLGKAKNFEPMAIGKLEHLVADWTLENHKFPKKTAESTKRRIAVVGPGPSRLAVTGDSSKLGYEVTIFEALHEAGDVLTYGIPEFRLSKKVVKQEIASIEALGVTIETNVVVGKMTTAEEIMSEFDTCYLSVGTGASNFIGIPRTSLNGVYSSNEFLTRINLTHSYEFPRYDTPIKRVKNVVVIDDGNVAVDAARSAKRLGAEDVNIVYRRSLEKLSVGIEEYHHSPEEGINYYRLADPIACLDDQQGGLADVECVKMVLSEPDTSGRRRPEPVPDNTFTTPADAVIEMIDQGASRVLLSTYLEIELDQWGYIQAGPEAGAVSIPSIFTGGDIVTSAAIAILAMGAREIAASATDQYVETQRATVTSNVQER